MLEILKTNYDLKDRNILFLPMDSDEAKALMSGTATRFDYKATDEVLVMVSTHAGIDEKGKWVTADDNDFEEKLHTLMSAIPATRKLLLANGCNAGAVVGN